MMRKFRDPWEMFWLWVLGRGLVHMLSELMTGPRLDDAVIAVLVLDPELVKIQYSDVQIRLRPRQRYFLPSSQLATVTLSKPK